jgi:hypothetical protein
MSIGGIMSVKPLSIMLAEEATAAAVARAQTANAEPLVGALTQLIRNDWAAAKQAKLHIEQEMVEAVYSRRGEYTPEKLAKIREQGGSEIYMMLFATKARQAKALITDVIIGAGTEKPWTISPSPKPDLPPGQVSEIMQTVQQMVVANQMAGTPMQMSDIRQVLRDAKDAAENEILESARREAERAEVELEDVMVEGGYMEALDQFIDDLTVFKAACLKGPVVSRESKLTWSKVPGGPSKPVVTQVNKLTWQRVDPFNLYPSRYSRGVNDGPLIERHRLTRGALSNMIGVDGYSEDAIRAVLDAHGTGGLHEWLQIDTARASAEGRRPMDANTGTDLIDALQYWGSVSGKTLLEWGMKKEEVPDEAKEYEIEAWLIGTWVIKAVLNPDPLSRRPYYIDGYSRIPGAFWHASLYDLLKDCQDMCNGAARGLANNLGISSGPQVVVNTDRLPRGEEITEMFPWKMWQTVSDPMGSSAAPITFFQPESNAAELMGVYEKFANLADEYSGIPRYMTGTPGDGGAGRTASGMSMMIGNASKQVKQVISSLDIHVIGPSVQGLFDWKMEYDPLTDYQGDLQIVARGALSLTTKDSAQVRRNEFLANTANPIDMQIIGLDGRAEVLRETVKTLDMDPNKIVPSASIVKAKAVQAQQAQQAQAPQGPQAQQPSPTGNGQELMNGAPVVDSFQPAAQ